MKDLERELLELRERVSASVTPSPGMADSVFRRAKLRRVVTGITAIIVMAPLALASVAAIWALEAPTSRAPVGPQPDERSSTASSLDFEPASGWHVRTTDPALVKDLGAETWASNVPFSSDEEEVGQANLSPNGWPDKSEEALPPDGIIITAGYAVQTRNPLPPIPDAPERALPLTIDDPPSTAYEGQSPDRALAVINATVNGRYLTVRVVFGTGRPAVRLIREAEEQLGRLVVAPPPATTNALHDFGVRMDLPQAWRGIVFSWDDDVPILQAATVPTIDLYDGSAAREVLETEDVFVVLAENNAFANHYERVVFPITIRAEDSCPTCEILDNGTSPPPDHSLFYRSFSVGGRQFDLFVEFGTATPTAEQLARVNDVLATLEIEPPRTPTPDESPEKVPDAPVSVQLPRGWIERDDPVPSSSAPRVVAAYGTWNLPTGGGCGPEKALQDLPPDGGLVWIVEYANPGNAGDYIALPRFSIDLQTPPGRWECAAAAPSRMYLFRVDGRFFEVHATFGPRASDAIIGEAERIVTSLRAEPSP